MLNHERINLQALLYIVLLRRKLGEILSLKWDQVDLKHGFMLLDKTKNGDRGEIPMNETLKDT